MAGFKNLAWNLADLGINRLAAGTSPTLTYRRFEDGPIRPDPQNPSKSTAQFTDYPGINCVLEPSVRGTAAGEFQLESRERFRRATRVMIARKGLPFTPQASDNPQSRDKFILDDDGSEWSVVEVSPGDPAGATFNLIGMAQTND